MPSIDEWLRRSWARFAQRWWELLAASGTAAAITMLAAFLPVLAAMAAASTGRWNPWAVWGVAGFVSLLLALWLSTWAQAAAIVAAMGTDDWGTCLRRSWELTPAFAWSLSLVLLGAGGGYFLFFLPGLWLTGLLFLAPFYALGEGAHGVASLELSWRRVSGRWWDVAGRLALAALIPFLIGLIPFVGWLLGMVAGPYSLVMLALLAEDLKASDPGDARPAPPLGLALAALALLFAAGTFFTVKAGWAAALELQRMAADGSLSSLKDLAGSWAQ